MGVSCRCPNLGSTLRRAIVVMLVACALLNNVKLAAAKEAGERDIQNIVDAIVKPLMRQHRIPGMAVGVSINGRRHLMHYGVASRSPHRPVTHDTLFELGSISKTFTATLAALAQEQGRLSLKDSVGQHMAELRDSPIGEVRLLHLATHTAGGFPLQLPDDVKDRSGLIDYLRAWRPQSAPGAMRSYANPSIGLLGIISASAMGETFADVMERRLFPALGLRSTFIRTPLSRMNAYAWGYSRDDLPVRVNPAMLADEAYGVKSSAEDMLRFLDLNMGLGAASPGIEQAVLQTQIGYFRSGDLVQALVWERYPYPVALEKIVAGNSPDMTMNAQPVVAIESPIGPGGEMLFNKTGSTNGFGAYVAFVPSRRIGIVLLANRNYPNEVRVAAAHRIISRLAR